MNIELRKDILEKSLIIESSLSGVLSLLFRFPKDESKTLGHSSNSLSFKTKTDLLLDLKRLDDRQYKELIMFMEIRNQLIHNLDTDTLLKAVIRCQKTNKLLELDINLKKDFNETESIVLKEKILKILVEELTQHLISTCKIILEGIENEIKLEELRKKKETESEFTLECVKFMGDSIDKVSEVYDEILVGDSIEHQRHKGQIKNLIWLHFMKEFKIKYPDLMKEFTAEIKKSND